MFSPTKVQYDVEGAVLNRNRWSSRLYQVVLYGVLLAVVVIGWVVYRQEAALQQRKQIGCQLTTTPTIEELTTITPETIRITEQPLHVEPATVATTTESTDASGLIDSLLSPFVQSESAIVELTLDTDGFLIKFGQNENNLTEVSKDSEWSTVFGMALRELLSLGNVVSPGRKVHINHVTEPEAATTTTEKTTMEEIFNWSTGNVLGFKFRYDEDHWELDMTSSNEEWVRDLNEDSDENLDEDR